jgi:hypothetical protein
MPISTWGKRSRPGAFWALVDRGRCGRWAQTQTPVKEHGLARVEWVSASVEPAPISSMAHMHSRQDHLARVAEVRVS